MNDVFSFVFAVAISWFIFKMSAIAERTVMRSGNRRFHLMCKEWIMLSYVAIKARVKSCFGEHDWPPVALVAEAYHSSDATDTSRTSQFFFLLLLFLLAALCHQFTSNNSARCHLSYYKVSTTLQFCVTMLQFVKLIFHVRCHIWEDA